MLKKLRALLAEHNLYAYLIPNKDPHLSEYLPDHYKIMPTLTGFTGSTGTMIVSQDFAHLWTDSRYFLQAEQELAESPFDLKKLDVPHTPQHVTYMVEHFPEYARIGVDARLLSISSFKYLKKQLDKKNIEIATIDLLSECWKERPSLPTNPVFEHALKFAGKSRGQKLSELRTQMKERGCQYYLQTALDDIAWTFNIRSNDVDYNPVAVCYALIGEEEATLFIDSQKISEGLKAKLRAEKIVLLPYHALEDALLHLPKKEKIYVDPKQLNYHLYQILSNQMTLVEDLSLAYFAKAIKNETELNHIRTVMVKDGVALLRLYRWIDANIDKGTVTEVAIGTRLKTFRAKQEHFVGESFPTIAGYNEHGAIIHYRATEKTDVTLQRDGILLIDSGGQYRDGTTDITRTTALGTPTSEQIRNFTLVLKGHIAVSKLRFPKDTHGNHIDGFARAALWQYGLNYGHGTGHGVGFFLNVHEGPHSMGRGATAYAKASFCPGMLITNEPGFYLDGEYGIRIENILAVKKCMETDFGEFYEFETLSWFPIDKQLIDKSLLTAAELDWLNKYHAQVYEKLSPHLEEDEKAWLREQTSVL